jgi:basic membrane protein A and related proteins
MTVTRRRNNCQALHLDSGADIDMALQRYGPERSAPSHTRSNRSRSGRERYHPVLHRATVCIDCSEMQISHFSVPCEHGDSPNVISTMKLCVLGIAASVLLSACNTDGSDGTETTINGAGSVDPDGDAELDDSTTTPSVTENLAENMLTLGGGTPTTPGAGSVCVVLDVDPTSLQNRSVVTGTTRAAAQFGVTAAFTEPATEADYGASFDGFVDDGCSLIVASSVRLANAAEVAANNHIDQRFAIVDYDYPNRIDNMMELTFNATEPAFLAGYLAGATTKTGVVATYAGLNIEPFTRTMDGFITGVSFYNREAGTSVEVLGWDGTNGRFVGSLDDPKVGADIAIDFVAQGADTIFPVAGDVGLGSAEVALASAESVRIIGIDNDLFKANPIARSVYLTSVIKNFDVAIVEAVERSIILREIGGQFVGTLENGAVDIAPFHEQGNAISEGLREQLNELRSEVMAGNVTTR